MPPTRHPGTDPARDLRELIAAGRFQDALAAYKRGEDDEVQRPPEAQLLAGTAATRIGDLDTGVLLAVEALERFRLRADHDGQMRALNLLGAISFERGQLADAEHCFQSTLRLAQQLDDLLLVARASNNLASVAHLRGRPDLALGLYRNALLSYQRLGDRRGTAETYHNLGITFRQLTEWRDAEDAADQAVRHAELIGERSLMALAISGQAEVRLERGDLQMAGQRLDRARRLAIEAGDEIGTADIGRLRALLALKHGDFELARREAECAHAVAARHGFVLLQAECAVASALALRQLGLAEGAIRRHDEALGRFQELDAGALRERFEHAWNEN